MKIACVLITHLPVKAEMLRRPELRNRTVIISYRSGSGPEVLDTSPDVKGVQPGMPLQEAVSRRKDAALLEADHAHYLRTFDRMIEALLQRSPLVERGELGCAFVEVGGLEPVYGGEAKTMMALLNALPGHFNPRVGLADSRFPAYVAAISSEGGQATRVPDDAAAFLRDLPVALLPISWESRARLRRFGLRTIGQVADLPLGSIQAQLGPEGRRAWDLANGIDDRPFVPARPRDSVTEYLSFPAPAVSLFAILPAVDTLLGRILSRPALRGKYIRSVTLEADVLDRAPWSKRFVFKSPVNEKGRALFALRHSLEVAEIPGPLEDMRMTVSELAGESGIQSSLFADVRKQQQLTECIRQLEARLRTRPPIYRVVDVEPWSRIPERRQALIEFAP